MSQQDQVRRTRPYLVTNFGARVEVEDATVTDAFCPKGSGSTTSAYASAVQSFNTVSPRPPFNPLPTCLNPIK
ncbi:hypothetical protein HL42_6385 [Trichophyton rubrum]|nr:hypothetical protein HL42_6385 [Trichophyton rubrum]